MDLEGLVELARPDRFVADPVRFEPRVGRSLVHGKGYSHAPAAIGIHCRLRVMECGPKRALAPIDRDEVTVRKGGNESTRILAFQKRLGPSLNLGEAVRADSLKFHGTHTKLG